MNEEAQMGYMGGEGRHDFTLFANNAVLARDFKAQAEQVELAAYAPHSLASLPCPIKKPSGSFCRKKKIFDYLVV